MSMSFHGKNGRVTVPHSSPLNFWPSFGKILRAVTRENCGRTDGRTDTRLSQILAQLQHGPRAIVSTLAWPIFTNFHQIGKPFNLTSLQVHNEWHQPTSYAMSNDQNPDFLHNSSQYTLLCRFPGPWLQTTAPWFPLEAKHASIYQIY